MRDVEQNLWFAGFYHGVWVCSQGGICFEWEFEEDWNTHAKEPLVDKTNTGF